MQRKRLNLILTILSVGATLVFAYVLNVYADSPEKQGKSTGCPFLKAIGSCCGSGKSVDSEEVSKNKDCCSGEKSKCESEKSKNDNSSKDAKNQQTYNNSASCKCCGECKCEGCKCLDVCKCQNCACKAGECLQTVKVDENRSTCGVPGCTCGNVCLRGKMCTCWFNA